MSGTKRVRATWTSARVLPERVMIVTAMEWLALVCRCAKELPFRKRVSRRGHSSSTVVVVARTNVSIAGTKRKKGGTPPYQSLDLSMTPLIGTTTTSRKNKFLRYIPL